MQKFVWKTKQRVAFLIDNNSFSSIVTRFFFYAEFISWGEEMSLAMESCVLLESVFVVSWCLWSHTGNF